MNNLIIDFETIFLDQRLQNQRKCPLVNVTQIANVIAHASMAYIIDSIQINAHIMYNIYIKLYRMWR